MDIINAFSGWVHLEIVMNSVNHKSVKANSRSEGGSQRGMSERIDLHVRT
jgi:hypothetical protein